MGAMFKVAATTYLMLMGLGINAYHISYSQPDHQRNTSEQKSLVDESSLVPFVIAGSKDPDKPEGESGGAPEGAAARRPLCARIKQCRSLIIS
jgi:hypothetical protein